MKLSVDIYIFSLHNGYFSLLNVFFFFLNIDNENFLIIVDGFNKNGKKYKAAF